MTRRLLATRGSLLATALLAASIGLLGCGQAGKGTGPKAPRAAQEPGTSAPPPSGTAQGVGPQFGISDAPTSGEGAKRPVMSPRAQSAYAAGMQAFSAGDLAGAQAQFLSATQADAKAYQAHYSLGVVRERLGDVSGASASFRKALGIVPDYEPAIVAHAVLLARTGKAPQAESFLQQYRARMPKSAAVLAALAEVKSIQGDSGEAQRLAQEALKRNPDYRPAMETLARDHYRNRRLDLALYALQGILDGYGAENPPRDKNNPQARLLRGLIYKEQGNKAGAMEELRRAIELRPDLVEARVHLATYLLESGNAPDAAPLLEGALRYDKYHLLGHLNLGDAYRLLGKTNEAKRELEWVLQRDPNLIEAHYNLGLLYLFSDSVPGMTPMQATDAAIRELEAYQSKKPRAGGGTPDDTEELITRAKSKKALIEAERAEKAASATAAARASQPGASQPSQAGASQPSQAGASQPSQAGASQPSQAGASQRSQAGASQPSQSGASQPPKTPPSSGALPPSGGKR